MAYVSDVAKLRPTAPYRTISSVQVLMLVVGVASAAMAANTPASQLTKRPVFKPIDPATLPSSSIDIDFTSADAQALKAAFRRYIDYVHAHGDRLDKLPPERSLTLTTISGQKIDSKALFLQLNSVQSHLTTNGLSLTSANLASVVPLNKAFAIASPFAKVTQSPAAFASPTPVPTATQTATSVANAETTCSPQTPEPKIFDSDRGWAQVVALSSNKAADGTPLSRCALDFEPQLTQVESGSPQGDIPNVEVTTPPISFGKTKVASGSIVSKISVEQGGSLLSLNSSLDASAIGQNFNVLRLAASVSRVNSQKLEAELSFSVGDATIYNVSDSVNPNYSFHVNPSKLINIVPPYRQKFGPATFEVDCKGMVGVDGKITTTPYGFLVSAKPKVIVQVDGGLSASYVFIEGSLSGTIDLVDSDGELGGIAAILVDPTASQFDPSFNNPPLIAVVRPFGYLRVSALKGSLSVKVRLAGNVTVFSQSIPISGGLRSSTVAISSPWSAYYVAPGGPATPTPDKLAAPTPASSATAAPSAADYSSSPAAGATP